MFGHRRSRSSSLIGSAVLENVHRTSYFFDKKRHRGSTFPVETKGWGEAMKSFHILLPIISNSREIE